MATGASGAPPRQAAAQAAPQPTVGEVFERVHTSVVTIGTIGRSGLLGPEGQVATSMGIGSGVMISPEGRILTASHVVQTADEIGVGFADGTVVKARVVGSDPSTDVAMIMLIEEPPPGATVAPIGNSDAMKVGDPVFVVGAPHGISATLTVGHLSARRHAPSPLRPSVKVEHLQTDAAINTGNSGGPMFNMRGEVVGIVSYIISKTGGSEGLGFAIASNTCVELMLQRKAMWSGLDYVILSGDLAKAFNLPGGKTGLLIQRVAKDSPGEKLGLRGGSVPVALGEAEFLLGGDVVLEVFGIAQDEEDAGERISARLDALGPDDTLTVKFLRGGVVEEVSKLRKELW
jgi:S1-C subfamily serine protease